MNIISNYYTNIIFMFPEILLMCSIIVLLIYGLLYTTSESHKYINLVKNIGYLSSFSLFLCLLLSIQNSLVSITLFNNVLIYTPFINFIKILILFFSMIFVLVSISYVDSGHIKTFEFYILVLFSVLGMLLLVSAYDFLSLYLALELQSLSFYLLASYKKNNIFSVEAGLKYFVLGVFSSSLYLFGVSLVYGFLGSINFEDIIKLLLCTDIRYFNILLLSTVFIYVSLLFKLSIVPFHMWVPDIYEGIPLPVALLFSTIPKFSFCGIFIFLYYKIFAVFIVYWVNILIIFSLLSIFIGTFGAFFQNKIKRFLAYSSISHIGFVFLSLSLGTLQSLVSVWLYLIIYVITLFSIWTIVMSLVDKKGNYSIFFTDLTGLFYTNPILAHCLMISLFSLSGIPPLAGFFSKYFIFVSLINNSYYVVALIGVILSVISSFYYIRIIKIMYFDSPKSNISYIKIPFINASVIIISNLFIISFAYYFNSILIFIYNMVLYF